MKKCVLLLCLVSLLFAKGATLKYRLELDGFYDSNVGQNITEESSVYVTPSLGLGLTIPAGSVSVLAGGTVTYENHLQKRLSTLNAPFLHPYVGMRAKIGPVTSTFRGRYAVYYSHTFVVSKLSYRAELDNRISLKKGRVLNLDLGLMYNDYYTNSSDGMRYTTALSYRKRFKKGILSSVEPFVDGEFNRAKSDTASYNQIELGVKTDFDLKVLNAGIALSAKKKIYGAAYEHPHTTEIFTPENTYAVGLLTLSKEIQKKLRLSLSGKLRFKDSTNPTMDYDRHTLTFSIRWSDTFF